MKKFQTSMNVMGSESPSRGKRNDHNEKINPGGNRRDGIAAP